jgi:hypothetical protein
MATSHCAAAKDAVIADGPARDRLAPLHVDHDLISWTTSSVGIESGTGVFGSAGPVT